MQMSILPHDQRFFYGDPPIVFNQDGVLPLLENPKTSVYPENSPARQACDAFNMDYTDILHKLHNVFNGQPHTLEMSITKMFELSNLAFKLVTIDVGDGKKAGPSFEFIPR